MRIVVLALGSRGDVQPYAALGMALKQAGHRVRIVAGDDFGALIQGQGLEFVPGGISSHEILDSQAARLAMGSGRNTLQAIRQIMRIFAPAFERIMEQSWQACRQADAVVYSTLGLGAYHIAEALGIPCFWALSMPILSRTRAWPSLLIPLHLPLGGGYNLLTHLAIERFFQLLLGHTTNAWRTRRFHLPPIPMSRWPYAEMNGRPVPRLYHYSPIVVPKPSDWGADIHVTGYWFLDRPPGWQPPPRLAEFVAAGPPPVYVGFGSMSGHEPQATTRLIVTALRLTGQRAVLLASRDGLDRAMLPDSVCAVDDVPHDWLFPQMAAVVHHGGAGTTGAGLRAGVPNVIIPFAGDQPFWAARVHALGAGPAPISRKALTTEKLAAAIQAATEDNAIRQKVAEIGRQIQTEAGAARAGEIIAFGQFGESHLW